MKTNRVLVVDDDRTQVMILQKLLERNKYQVQSAPDGPQALRMIPVFKPHVVLLDVMMPKENGYRVCRMIKTLVPHTLIHVPKVLLLTARRLGNDRARERQFLEFSMADGMMYKPYDAAKLMATIEDLMAPEPQAQPAGGAKTR